MSEIINHAGFPPSRAFGERGSIPTGVPTTALPPPPPLAGTQSRASPDTSVGSRWRRKEDSNLWTRAIHLLQMEPSRSAETPNSRSDLKDMACWRLRSRIQSGGIKRRGGRGKKNKNKTKPWGWISVPPARSAQRKPEWKKLRRRPPLSDALPGAVLGCFGDGTGGNLQLCRPRGGTIAHCLPPPHSGEHYSPSLACTMGRVRRVERARCCVCGSHRTAG